MDGLNLDLSFWTMKNFNNGSNLRRIKIQTELVNQDIWNLFLGQLTNESPSASLVYQNPH